MWKEEEARGWGVWGLPQSGTSATGQRGPQGEGELCQRGLCRIHGGWILGAASSRTWLKPINSPILAQPRLPPPSILSPRPQPSPSWPPPQLPGGLVQLERILEAGHRWGSSACPVWRHIINPRNPPPSHPLGASVSPSMAGFFFKCPAHTVPVKIKCKCLLKCFGKQDALTKGGMISEVLKLETFKVISLVSLLSASYSSAWRLRSFLLRSLPLSLSECPSLLGGPTRPLPSLGNPGETLGLKHCLEFAHFRDESVS